MCTGCTRLLSSDCTRTCSRQRRSVSARSSLTSLRPGRKHMVSGASQSSRLDADAYRQPGRRRASFCSSAVSREARERSLSVFARTADFQKARTLFSHALPEAYGVTGSSVTSSSSPTERCVTKSNTRISSTVSPKNSSLTGFS